MSTVVTRVGPQLGSSSWEESTIGWAVRRQNALRSKTTSLLKLPSASVVTLIERTGGLAAMPRRASP